MTALAIAMVMLVLVGLLACLSCAGRVGQRTPAVPGMLACGGGHAHQAPRLAHLALGEDLPADQRIDLRLVLPHRDPAGLEAHLHAMADPNSPAFGRPMDHATFVARHLATPEMHAAAEAHLQSHGIEVVGRHATHLRAQATAAQLQAALGAKVARPAGAEHMYTWLPRPGPLRNDHPFAAHLGASSRPLSYSYARAAKARRSRAPLDAPGLRQSYDVPAAFQGEGARMGVVQLGGYDPGDIAAYCAHMGIREVPRTHIRLGGYDGAPRDQEAQVEVTLDIELMNAMAPGAAELRVYQADQGHNAHAFYDLLAEVTNPTQGDRARMDHISCSWGTPERSLTAAQVAAEALLFRQLAATGRNFYAASGDAGAYDSRPNQLETDDPASQPYVVGVGGTSLWNSDKGEWAVETTWPGSGGGVSCWWAAPPWQKDALQSQTRRPALGRDVPDVALHADPQRGHAVYVRGQWMAAGGTSCAAPAWAALGAVIDSARAQGGLPPLGFLPPRLYALGAGARYTAAFHDITEGANGYYPAHLGADEATGLGSPRAAGLIEQLTKP